MIPGKVTNLLKGIGGEFELNRVVGFIGGIAYVICANFFVWYQTVWKGVVFDVTTYCLAFPGGLAVVAGGTAAAISLKDRNVASSKIIEQTGAVPTPAPDGPKVPIGEPPPVDKPATETVDDRPTYAQ